MNKALHSIFLLFMISVLSYGQQDWNWPEDPDQKSLAMEKQAYYKLLIAQSKYDEALAPLSWLYENNPDLNQSIYIEGVDCLKEVIKKEDDKQRVATLQDSILWMYDQRMKYFDNDAYLMDRKSYQAFQLFYKDPAKYGDLLDMYEKAYEMNGADISIINLNPYMLLAKFCYQYLPDRMPAEKVLDIHSQISEIIEIKKKNGENATKLKKEQDKTDAWLTSIPDILSCEFIEEKLVPKFRENPADISNAKKIFSYSIQAKCIDQPYWLEASETVFKEQPSYKLAVTIGNKYNANREPTKALEYLQKAVELASDEQEKFDALMGQAVAYSKMGSKSKARSLAYSALSAKPGSAEAYNMIGNLYFTSYDDCKGGKSKVMDRAVFIAAYKMYEKAGNRSQMNASKEQFPSIEEIFNEGMKEEQPITVGCWINETVALQRR